MFRSLPKNKKENSECRKAQWSGVKFRLSGSSSLSSKSNQTKSSLACSSSNLDSQLPPLRLVQAKASSTTSISAPPTCKWQVIIPTYYRSYSNSKLFIHNYIQLYTVGTYLILKISSYYEKKNMWDTSSWLQWIYILGVPRLNQCCWKINPPGVFFF